MKTVHCKLEKFDVYIGRYHKDFKKHSFKWGNPFVIGVDGTREEVIEKYEKWIRSQSFLMKSLPELKDKTLGCWCDPLACHGEVLIKLVDELYNPVIVPVIDPITVLFTENPYQTIDIDDSIPLKNLNDEY